MNDHGEMELDVNDFLDEVRKTLSSKIAESMKIFLDEIKKERGGLLLTTEELVLFLVEDCRVQFGKVAILLKRLGFSDSDIRYFYTLTGPSLDEAR
ncbi:MAG: hypothetical protein J7L38_03595 [Thermoproteales archaeon]|nr:hypothetical protein [Thermoproteales archaeon]RLE63723.1 MAG: hypothetical protein DRJ47_09090 [Thermoprotei archaeon]